MLMKNIRIARFQTIREKDSTSISLSKYLANIKVGKYRFKINMARKALEKGAKDAYDQIKRDLGAVAFSVLLYGARQIANIKKYNRLVILDVDHLSTGELKKHKAQLKKDAYVLAVWKSPSGQGLKFLVKVNSKKNDHSDAFKIVSEYFSEAYGIAIDHKGKDVCRLCFDSYDKNIFINWKSKIFDVKPILLNIAKETNNQAAVTATATNEAEQIIMVFEDCIKYTNLDETYIAGNRNNYIHYLANNCNRIGISKEDCLDLIIERFDLDDNEIRGAVNSAYKNSNDFRKFHGIKGFIEKYFKSLLISEASALAVPIKDLFKRAKKQPKQKTLWSGIKENSLGFFVGLPKSGKTTLAECLAISIACERKSFLNMPIDVTNKRVLFISLEEYWMPRTERNKKQISTLKINEQKLVRKNLFVIDEKFPRLLTTAEEWAILENEIKRLRPSVLIIDSLNRLYSGKIEDSSLAKVVTFRLKELGNKYSVTIIIIHHATKNATNGLTLETIAGSRIISQEADFIIGINRINSTRYIKNIAFRYADDSDTSNLSFEIDINCCIKLTGKVNEWELNQIQDGRTNSANRELILQYMKDQLKSGDKVVTAKNLSKQFIDSKVLVRATLYSCLKKLISEGKIEKVGNGEYSLKQ